ncbi:transposase [Ferribacterium limneticum]|uniref:transposase n=1 Tax=Ferribacterium limneticum TaxID=76259 RepID=UPI001CF849A7|nr:transposase [Ferribacterium limneticum]UCV21508.1 transposase [Ferribacterium limneticum]
MSDRLSPIKRLTPLALVECIEAMNATVVIPPRANRKESRSYDKHVYKSRNLIERVFACLKQFRRIVTRYDKLDIRFEAFISIAAALIWLA